MAQHDYVIANASGATVRADINNMALAISSNNSGSSAPSTTYAYLWWLDTSANVLKLRNSANNAWITMPFSIGADNTVDINGGAIDGTSIGASAASTGAFTTLAASGLTTLSGDLTLASATANKPVLTLTDTNADSQGPDLVFKKDSASPADGDELFRIYGYGDDSGGTQTEYFLMLATMEDVTDGTEDSKVRFMTYGTGSQQDTLTLAGSTAYVNNSSPFAAGAAVLHLHQPDATSNAYLHITQQDGGATSSDGMSIGVLDGGTNAVIRLRENGFLATYTNNTEKMRIDASGNVGIGNTSMSSYDSNARNLVVGSGTGDEGMTIASGSGSGGRIYFADGTGSDAEKADGFIFYNHASQYLMLGIAGGVEAARWAVGSGSHECMSIGGVTPRSDISLTQQGHGENWASGAHTTNGYFYVINSANYGVYVVGGQNAWTSNSDERIKENITSLGTILPEIANIRCVKFNLKGDSETRVGFIAQDWESKSFSEVLNVNDGFVVESDGTVKASTDSDSTDKVKGIAYTETIPVLLKAIQEQQTIIESLTARITTLEGE